MQASIDIAPHIAEIKRALGAKAAELDDKDVADELRKYLDYGVPAEQAVRTILRHHGVQSAPRAQAPVSQERITIANLPATAPSVNLKVRVLTLNTKNVKARGEDKEVLWGLFGDETGTVPYTSWRPLEGLQKGDVVEVKGAYTKEYQGKAQVNLGDRTQLTKLPADALPKTPDAVREATTADLKDGMRGIRITARVLSITPRQVTVQGQPRTVWGGQIADASGQVEFSAWSDPNLTANAVVTIEGGYVRAFRGVPQLTFDADAKITPYSGDFPDATSLAVRPPMKLRDLVLRGGGSDITIDGVLLDIKEGSGLVMRCSTPGCTRVLAAGICRIHNKVEPVPDLRIKAVVDDGTAAVSLVAGRELTEALLGKDLEACKKEAQASFRPQVIQEQLAERLTGRPVRARGNALGDEYGITFIARSLDVRHEDTADAAKHILAQLEAA
jgi:replication factor A1